MLDMGSYPNSDYNFTTIFNNNNSSNNKIQRRFTNQQIKSLETIFQTESKLEPRKKLELAKDLGLQPKQVAIWFQNKRARWRSKQLEKDYNMLRASFDSLSSRYDLLNKENQSLTQQLNKLREVIEKKTKSSCSSGEITGMEDEKVSCDSNSNGNNSMKKEYVEEDDKKNMNMCIMEKRNVDDLECDQLLDDDTSNQWWDLWC
ncbi:hypothetical protein QVD17_21693 [Tagetes erecta]|uniref:Homeobox-leucine zipper protein n=1 Tax=Tagetes erecta TaxID=13708 RepID=A0AAD8KIJ5_TARER|nr:hypothetical protein QVD17_21693 [Tagetes erecta]